ncbi:hypothetical protein P9W85_22170 [Bacillus tropicus]|uniref:sunset domain-containing protein n=1 Tax=Bacillus tropicus TaxID=2026188 RepID=UPI002DB70D0A|nr:hypothetical protein [Bacillus tropicus]MEC2554056.1 hypothetical protein [Bacillus tropicus]
MHQTQLTSISFMQFKKKHRKKELGYGVLKTMLPMISIQVLQQTLIILKQILPPSQNNSNDNKESNVVCKRKIKGNANSKIYHVPDGSFYKKTTNNIVWFCTEKEAQENGYVKSKR